MRIISSLRFGIHYDVTFRTCFDYSTLSHHHADIQKIAKCIDPINALIFFMVQQPLVRKSLIIIEISRSHSDTSTRLHTSGRVISPKQRTLPHNTEYSKERDIHASGGVLTRNPNRRAASNPLLRPRSQWDRLNSPVDVNNTTECVTNKTTSLISVVLLFI